MTLPARIKRPRKKDDRLRSQKHLKWVRGHHCVVKGCMDMPIEAAHVRLGRDDGAMGRKPPDSAVISLCRAHHAEQHAKGEETFANHHALDLPALALEFAQRSPVPEVRKWVGGAF
jgi:hypothetical protein